MYERQIEPSSLGISRLLSLFAVLSVVFVLVLAIAPAKSQLREWRSVQQRYDELAAVQGVAAPDVAIQQIWNPKLKVVDRCTTCHLGMGAAEPIAGERLFAAHPALPHDPADLGCTICHAGQGRATTAAAAHGRVKHWEDPMLERKYLEAGCGNCHTHLTVASPKLAERGAALFVRYDCVACHVVGDAGRGSSGPNLSTIGTRGVPPTWHERHLTMRASREAPEWRDSYGDIPAEDRAALFEYLKSLHGAPKLVRAKALAHELGCRGCHKINGIGGDDGPDLTNVGRKLEHDFDFSHVAGPHTRSEWLKQHFLAPDKVVAGSKMPPLAVTDEQAELLTLYMLSLRPAELPQESWPKDRILGARFGARDFSGDGETLYGVFCAACHGPKGEGRRWANSGNFPAIGSRDFLAIADDELIRQTITHGRPGRRMPAWGTKDGGLSREEIDAIVAYVRSFAPGTPEPWGETLPAGVADRGAPIFAKDCSGCHGARGEGNIGPQLSNAAFLAAASDAFIARTIIAGRPSAGMRHFGVPSVSFEALTLADVADVVAFIRALGNRGSQESKEGVTR